MTGQPAIARSAAATIIVAVSRGLSACRMAGAAYAAVPFQNWFCCGSSASTERRRPPTSARSGTIHCMSTARLRRHGWSWACPRLSAEHDVIEVKLGENRHPINDRAIEIRVAV